MPRGEMSPQQRQAQGERMKDLWKTPAFVDGQIRQMVRRWDSPHHRRRQNVAIAAGRRQMPFAQAPRGTPCPGAAVVEGHGEVGCLRQDNHAYHVGTVGSVEDGDLRLVGWDD